MRIILNQQEIEEAILEKVTSQISIQEDQAVTVDFQDDKNEDLNAVIIIGGARPEAKPEPAKAEPKPRGRPRKEATPEPVKEEAKADVPWVEPVKIAETRPDEIKATANLQEHLEEVKAIKAEAAAANKIFPEIGTSAPPAPAVPTPPTSGSKSLFANLTKPVHDSPKN